MCLCRHVQLFATPWTIAHQAPLSMGFPRQEYRGGLPFPSPSNLPILGIEPISLASPALTGRFFTTRATWEALCVCVCACVCVCGVSIHSKPCDQLVFIKLGLLMEIRKTGYKTICTLRFFCFCFCFCFTYKPSDSETPLSGSTTGKDWNQTRKYYKQVPLGDEIIDYFFHLELFSFFRDYLLF